MKMNVRCVQFQTNKETKRAQHTNPQGKRQSFRFEMTTKHQPQVLPASADAVNINLSEIASRWKFRPSGTHQRTLANAHQPWIGGGGGSAAPPDLRSDFLKLRAELLRKEPLMGQVPPIEAELAATIDALRSSELLCKELQLQVQDSLATQSESQRQLEKQAEHISRLQRELSEVRGQLDEEKQLRLRNPSAASAGLLSPQGSFSGALASPNGVVVRSTPVVAAQSMSHVRTHTRAVSPSASKPAVGARSPARTRLQ